jgi:hypothetical protein
MPFIRSGRSDRREGGSQNVAPVFRRFGISNASYNKSMIAVSATTSILLLLYFSLHLEMKPEQTDVQTLSTIIAGIAALCFSIPIFLKEMDYRSNFWKHFLVAGFMACIATLLGSFTFLTMEEKEPLRPVTLNMIICLVLVISLNYKTAVILLKGRRHSKKNWLTVSLDFRQTIILLFVSLLICFVLSHGDRLMLSFLIASMYSFFLIGVILLSILIEFLFRTDDVKTEMRIKQAIEEIADKYKDMALSEQIVIDKLRKGFFSAEEAVISRTKVLELITEMDGEIESDQPKITIYSHDQLIPRWNNDYTNLLLSTAAPVIIVPEEYNLEDKTIEAVYSALSDLSGLSVELLKDNNTIDLIYPNSYRQQIRIGLDYFNSSSSYYFAICQQNNSLPPKDTVTISDIDELGRLYEALGKQILVVSTKNVEKWGLERFILDYFSGSRISFDDQIDDQINRDIVLDLVHENPGGSATYYSALIFKGIIGHRRMLDGFVGLWAEKYEDSIHKHLLSLEEECLVKNEVYRMEPHWYPDL